MLYRLRLGVVVFMRIDLSLVLWSGAIAAPGKQLGQNPCGKKSPSICIDGQNPNSL
jgi:hypothetical protein